jgi:hypothetical protein
VLDGLVDRTAVDPGAPFEPQVLAGLATLKKEDRAAFEALRTQLKRAGCRMTALDRAIAEEKGDVGGRYLVHRVGLPFPALASSDWHRKGGFYLSACPTHFFKFSIRCGLPARSGSAKRDAPKTKAKQTKAKQSSVFLSTLRADYSFSPYSREEGTVTRLYG